jgi:hypothetical protein
MSAADPPPWVPMILSGVDCGNTSTLCSVGRVPTVCFVLGSSFPCFRRAAGDDVLACPHAPWGDVPAGCSFVGLGCMSSLVSIGNTMTPSQGEVHVFHSGDFSTVCSDGFTDEDATVVCRELGFTSGAALSVGLGIAEFTAKIAGFNCVGDEATTRDCAMTAWNDSLTCPSDAVAAVRCDGFTNVRLVDGETPYSGRLEVLYDGEYHSVCTSGADGQVAEVVCRSLGFAGGVLTTGTQLQMGDPSQRILPLFYYCGGTELNLESCYHTALEAATCTHDDDVGVMVNTLLWLHLGSCLVVMNCGTACSASPT